MFRPYSSIIRLTNFGVSQGTECNLTNTTVCKPDDGRSRPKHAAYLYSFNNYLQLL